MTVDTNGHVPGGENSNPYLGHSLDGILREHLITLGLRNMDELTVMAKHRDPYRQQKYQAQAEWFARQVAKVPHLPIHVRGLHYAAIGDLKPDLSPYRNTERDYAWMQDQPAKAGRWLGTVPFSAIVDQKNDPPRIAYHQPPAEPEAWIGVGGVRVSVPEDLAPEAILEEFRGTQPYRLVVFAEKSAVAAVVGPIARRYGADTYFEGGEISDTHLYDIAARGAADGRETVVFTFTDADPAGYWMPCVVARKLQALRENWFPEFSFRVQPVGLLPEQVEAINAAGDPLPSSPLKEGEKRAGAWEEKFGIQQVELDAIATLRPDVLKRIATTGMRPFFDASLARRVWAARREWEKVAQAALEEQLGEEQLERIRAEAEEKVAELKDLAAEIDKKLMISTRGLELPVVPAVPDPVLRNGTPSPLVTSEMGFVDLTLALKARGAYAKDGSA
jgi:hypothetical protein